eukprot:m.189385 g.189385  ORF g.189385 m.189385 type:complete len:360 (+) comp10565_c0_seq5:173-1252(+)
MRGAASWLLAVVAIGATRAQAPSEVAERIASARSKVAEIVADFDARIGRVSDETLEAEARPFMQQLYDDAPRLRLVHVHIPKSGGTAFSMAMSSGCDCHRGMTSYSCNRCPQPTPINRLTQGWPCRIRDKPFIFPTQRAILHPTYYEWVHECPDIYNRSPQSLYITSFREPLARFLSEARHCRTRTWCFGVTPGRNTHFNSWIEMPSNYSFHDRMTRMIDPTPLFAPLDLKNTMRNGEDWQDSGVRLESLKRAINVLRSDPNFFFITHEELGDGIEMLEHLLRRNLTIPSQHSHHNAEYHAKENADLLSTYSLLSETQVNTFLAKNTEDVYLVDFARRLFAIRRRILLEEIVPRMRQAP